MVGAGLGGLTAAGFLQRSGFTVKVYEQAPAFSRIGAGIILSANATKVLRRLGLEEALIGAGIKSQQYISRAWDTGATMYEIAFDAASERRFGGAYVHIHRGDLHTVLERAVAPGTIAFDHQLVDLEEKAGAVQLVFANGASGRSRHRDRRRRHPLESAGLTARRRAAAFFRGGRLPGDLSGRSPQRPEDSGLHQVVGQGSALPALLPHRPA